MTDPVPTTDVAAPPTHPTVNENVKVDAGSMLAQLEETLRPFASTALGAAYAAFAPGLVQQVIAPAVVRQYADQAIVMLEGATRRLHEIDTGTASDVVAAVVNLVSTREKAILAWIGGEVEPYVTSVLTKAGLQL